MPSRDDSVPLVVVGLEPHPAAFALAEENAKQFGLSDRYALFPGTFSDFVAARQGSQLDSSSKTNSMSVSWAEDLPSAFGSFDPLRPQGCSSDEIESSYNGGVSDMRFDLIVSNPPFFSGGTFGMKEERAIARQTVRMPHGDLLIAVRQLLAENGRFCLVLPYLEGLRFQERAQEYHLFCTKVTEVHPRATMPVNRLLMQFEQEEKPAVTDQLIIRDNENEGSYTEAYRELLQGFLLKF
jgi:tRNA1(Val) A37 N6-methylase TrmN6